MGLNLRTRGDKGRGFVFVWEGTGVPSGFIGGRESTGGC